MSRFTSLAILILVLAGGSVEADAVESVPGLVAWYDVNVLHDRLREGEEVDRWEDSSGNGHTLIDRRDGLTALFEILQVGERPVVHVRKLNTHLLESPFEFDDHTIFLVVSAGCSPCGLLHSTAPGEEGTGILLRGDGDRAFLHAGKATVPYTDPLGVGDRFVVLALGREAGVLHGFLDDRDVSSLAGLDGKIQVGSFFSLPLTRAVTRHSDGLRVAEMIFFDRYLTAEERIEVTSHLGAKYEIDLFEPAPGERRAERIAAPRAERVRAHLGLGQAQNVNVASSVFVLWDVDEKVEEPFRHDAEKEPERLYCTRDGTQVRIRVVLQLATEVAGASVDLLLLKNEDDWRPEEVNTGPIEGGTGRVVLDALLDLDAGDWISVVTEGVGAEGAVNAIPDGSEIVVEVL